jgi:S-disulfanyl-L-cysteine oxidoreductase SoxD
MSAHRFLLLAWLVATCFLREQVLAAEGPPSFSEAQAERGHAAYQRACLMCHGERLDDGDFGGAPLRGAWFREHWGKASAASLYAYMQSAMPPDNPGGLSDTAYSDILAFILQRNGYEAGAQDIPTDLRRLEEMTLER